MEDFKLIAGIILGGGDRLYTRNDYIQFAYIGGEPPILIPDYHFKVLQANGKLEGFGQDIGEQIDIINIDIEGEGTTYTFPQDSELYTCYVYLEATSPPLGSALTVNVYDTSRLGNPSILDTLLTIPAGQTKSLPNILTIPNFSAGAVLQISVISVGSEFPGAGVKLILGRKYNEGEEFDWERVGLTNTGNGYIAVFTNTPNYMIVKENGNVSFFTPTKTNYLFEAIPNYEYLGEDNLWFWRKYNSERQSETISYNGSQGKTISTGDYTISLLQPRLTPSDDNYIAPTLINTSQLPHPGVVLMSNSLVTQYSTKLKSFVDTIEETTDINTTFSSSSPPGGPNTENYSNTWNGKYLHNVVESGIKENVSTDELICNASGTATGSLIRTFEEVEGGFYELVSGSDVSSTTGSLVGTSKNGSRLECHVEAEYTKTVLPTTVSANRGESVEQLTFSPILLAKNEAIEMKIIKKEWTKYICNVSRENSSAECITDVEVVCGDNIFIGEMTLNNTKYYYNNHSEGGYQWENIFFITSPDELDPVTGGEIGNLSVRSALGSDYPFYQQITKKETRTKNSMGVTNAYEYFTQTPIVLSGEVDIFSWDGSMYNLYRGNIQESGSSMQTISLGLGREEVKKIYENISVNINEFVGKSMIPSTAKTVIVPKNAYDEWVWYQVRFNFSMCNFYKVDGTVELAISEQKPNNNNFGGAVLLEGQNVSVRGNNYGADWQGTLSEPSLSPPTQSVWYKWVAPSSNAVVIHTLGSPVAADYQVDTVIAVYTGSSLDNLSLVASNDDASVELPPNGDYLSAVVINPTEGTTYYIQVDGWSDTQWSFVLSITTEGLNVPTPIQEETRRADIYRFDTQTLKWKRMPNAVSAISPLTGASDFISYHATPQTETLDGEICPEE